MARQGSGSIVTIASVCAWRSVPLHAYGPAKAAVVNLSQSLSAEWGRSGVRVNSISPGYTVTPALENAIRNGRDVTVLKDNAALGRLVEADEVGKAAAFLLSDDASAITGIDLPVDAGWLAGSSWLPYGGVRPSTASN
jgi:NAD(P)-dependent dehydrogenase (short-subunit alcohol dehydrogenase family)